MDEMNTGSAHTDHCFCVSNTAGQKMCCHCGLLLAEAVRVPLRFWQDDEAKDPRIAALEAQVKELKTGLREACDWIDGKNAWLPTKHFLEKVARLRALAEGK